ncbi:MAG: helix-turn-helix domain-containing protein, partial [Deltaproteobacteria bacterium]|nr:helix-turn-helix domain-containing protein [Deltaproteobacteria bacterium]
MSDEKHKTLIEKAARASIERIRLDGKKAPERLKILFAYLEQHIFERGLDVNQMKRACGKRDNSISSFFAEVAVLGPYAYMVARRVETAAALLRDTNLSIRIISRLVGFTKPGILTQHFKAQHGMTPREYRLDMNRNVSACAPSVPAKGSAPHKSYAFSVEDIEKIKAEALWDVLREKPLAGQRDIIRHSLALPTPALFHLLRKKSASEGRDNRRLGVEFSELAIESLRVTEHIIGRDLFDL